MRATWPVRLTLVGLFLLMLGLPVAARPAPQSPFEGQIISPQPGSELRGNVEIVGFAKHPNFWKYDVYALTGRVEDEWIPIATGVEQQVETPARLAVWNTTTVPDGEYILLLRVWDRNQGLQDFQFHPYYVVNSKPLASPTPVASPTPLEILPTVPPQTPTVVIEQPPTATPLPTPTAGGPPTVTPTARPSALAALDMSSWKDAFCSGVWLAVGLFALWGVVWLIRTGVRWVLKQQRKRRFAPPR